jgi:hypothetical protein
VIGDQRHFVSMLKLHLFDSFDFPVTLYTTFLLSLQLIPKLSIMSALAGKQGRNGSDQEDNSSKEEGNSDGHQKSNAEKGSKGEGPPQPVGLWDPRLSHVRKRAYEADHYKYVCISSRPQLEPTEALQLQCSRLSS